MVGLTDEQIEARRRKRLEALDAEISSGGWDTLLLSAEGVSHLSESELAKLKEWGEGYANEWTVLVCVRHPLDWTRSVVQQRLQGGETLGQLYEDMPATKYRARISRAVSVFGRENVRVFDFESAAGGEGGIVGAFAREAGLGAGAADFLASRSSRDNESLSWEAARILDSLNRQRPPLVDGARAARRAGPEHEVAYLRRIGGRKFDLPDFVKREIGPRNREDVAWLNGEFGLELYPDVLEDAPGTPTSPDTAGASGAQALSDEAIDGIAGVLGDLVTAELYHRALGKGREALARGKLARAERVLREAARLDPEAPQPKELLEELGAKGQESERRGGRRAGRS